MNKYLLYLLSSMSILMPPMASASIDELCMDRLYNLIIDQGLHLFETGMNDGKPLTLVLQNFSSKNSTVEIFGTKKGYKAGGFLSLDGRPRRIQKCLFADQLITVKMDRLTILEQSDGSFKSSCCLIWKSHFIIIKPLPAEIPKIP